MNINTNSWHYKILSSSLRCDVKTCKSLCDYLFLLGYVIILWIGSSVFLVAFAAWISYNIGLVVYEFTSNYYNWAGSLWGSYWSNVLGESNIILKDYVLVTAVGFLTAAITGFTFLLIKKKLCCPINFLEETK